MSIDYSKAYNKFTSMKNSPDFCLPTSLYSSQTLENSYPVTTVHYLSSYQKLYNENQGSKQGDSRPQGHSLKKCTPRFDFSFQKAFLREHTATFHYSFQNYKEFIRTNQHNTSKKSALGQIQTRSDLQHPTVSSLLEESQNHLTKSQRQQFLKALSNEEKLKQFLEQIVSTLSPEESTKFVLIAHSIWQSYVPRQMQDLEAKDFIRFGEEITEKKIMNKFKAFFTEDKKNTQLHKTLLEFFKTFCITILLILGKFFQNPFYDESASFQAPKRALKKVEHLQKSDSEEDFQDPEPRKKLKQEL